MRNSITASLLAVATTASLAGALRAAGYRLYLFFA